MPPTVLSTARTEDEAQDLSAEDLWLEFWTLGGRDAHDRLVLHYTGLVAYVASRLGAAMPNSVDYSDLIQSGVIGLMDAVERFEPERGLKFETYAVARIRGEILDAARAEDWVPRSVRRRARDLDAAAESCRSRLGRTPTSAELAEELGVTSDDVSTTRALASRMRVWALDEVVACGQAGESLSIAETLADPFAELPGDALDRKAERDALWAALGTLNERDRAILVHAYFDGLTLAQIGKLLGVTESRVCQLRARALRELAARLAPQRAA